MSLKTVSSGGGGGGGNGTGTVTNVATGTGLTGGPITISGTVSLANTAVTPGTYGDGTHVSQVVIDQQGRITSASNVIITAGSGTVTNVGTGTGLTGGPITNTGNISLANTAVTAGTYADSTHVPQIVIDAQGRITSASNVAIAAGGSGTVTNVATGTGLTGGPVTTTGTISLANTAVTPATYGNATYVSQITVDQQGRITAASNVAISAAGSGTVNAGTTPNVAYYAGNGTAVSDGGSATVAIGAVAVKNALSGSSNVGVINYGTLSFNDSNSFETLAASANGYTQIVIQNASNGTLASADYVVNNDQGNATTHYGDFGINSSLFSGTGNLALAGAVYLYGATADLVLGTTTANAIHFVVNASATDAMIISATGNVAINTNVKIGAGQILTSSGVGNTAATTDGIAQTFSGGLRVTSNSLGTINTGTLTLDTGNGPQQYVTNNGAFTLAAPANDGNMLLLVTNGNAAGTITPSGFSPNSFGGDALTTTNTSKFVISVMRINGTATAITRACQ